MNRKILIVEDNLSLSQLQKEWLEKEGYEVVTAINEPAARKSIRKEAFDLILSDVRLPEGNGISFLEWLVKEGIRIPFVVMTDYASYSDAVRAIKLGAEDYLPKPVYREQLLELIRELLNAPSFIRKQGDPLFVRTSMQARNVDRLARLVAPSDMSVLILGANGTGKESVAQSIHRYSDRKDMPFVAVNCGAVPKELAPSMFFGHVKGAFTGADINRKGYFGIAQGGTLFLDEIGTLTYEIQAMLLRVLQENTYIPIGDTHERIADVRIISATNEDLPRAIQERRFREDLYHRLSEFEIRQPSLSECPDDILPLADFFRERFSKELKRETWGFSKEAQRLLLTYPWPGNVRELHNKVKRAVLVSEYPLLSVEDMGFGQNVSLSLPVAQVKEQGVILALKNDDEEKKRIQTAIEKTRGNLTETARLLGVSRVTLYAKLKKYGLAGFYVNRKSEKK